jgi:delta-aminolevulinic acid dehydratase/porphobilinogen synthase
MRQMALAPYPMTRFRRLRATDARRRLVSENMLTADDLIWPVFVMEGQDTSHAISSMPGVERLTIDRIVRAAEVAATLGIPAICLFPYHRPVAQDRNLRRGVEPRKPVESGDSRDQGGGARDRRDDRRCARPLQRAGA